MPNCDQHWEQAEHNESLAKEIISQVPIAYRDWGEIVSFYSSIHFVEAYMADQFSWHSDVEAKKMTLMSPHYFRSKFVRERLSIIQCDYDELSIASKMLRYLTDENGMAHSPKGTFFSEDDIKSFFNENLQSVKSEIATRLGKTVAKHRV